jgi:hypothetical protein
MRADVSFPTFFLPAYPYEFPFPHLSAVAIYIGSSLNQTFYTLGRKQQIYDNSETIVLDLRKLPSYRFQVQQNGGESNKNSPDFYGVQN